MKQITVLLAEDHTVVREGLRALLDIAGGFTVVGDAGDGLAAIELTRTLRPDVLVMDIAMPKLNGLEAARRILEEEAPPKILILSAHGDDVYVEKVASLGVSGYLVKQTSAHRLAEAIREIQKGKVFYSPSVSERIEKAQQAVPGKTPRFSPAGRPRKRIEHLTAREREVLQLVAEGMANKQVASELAISIKTVEKHRQSVMEKLDIHETAGLTRYAIAAGLVESSVQVTII